MKRKGGRVGQNNKKGERRRRKEKELTQRLLP